MTFSCCPVIVCGMAHVKEHRTQVMGSVYALCTGCFILIFAWAISSPLRSVTTDGHGILHTISSDGSTENRIQTFL